MKTQLLYKIEIGRSTTIRLAAYGTLLIFLGLSLFNFLVNSGDNQTLNPLITIAVFTATIGVHELIHGLFFKLFGGKPKYGVGVMYKIMPYAYATARGYKFSLRQMSIIGLAPLLLISILSIITAVFIPETVPYMAVVFVSNFSGAVGDMWLIRQLFRFRRIEQVSVIDEKTGISVYGIPGKQSKIVAKMKSISSDQSNLFIKPFINAFIVLFLLSLVLLIVFARLAQGDVTIGLKQLPLLEVINSNPESGVELSVNFLPILFGSAIYATIIKFVKRSRKV